MSSSSASPSCHRPASKTCEKRFAHSVRARSTHLLRNANETLQWVPEITHHCSKTPFLIVGTQIDLRDDSSMVEKLAKNRQRPISFEQGEKLAKELKAVKYVECSALTQVCHISVNASQPIVAILHFHSCLLALVYLFYVLPCALNAMCCVAERSEECVRRGDSRRARAALAREEEEMHFHLSFLRHNVSANFSHLCVDPLILIIFESFIMNECAVIFP